MSQSGGLANIKGCDTSRRRSIYFEYGSPSRRSLCWAICKHRKHNGIYSQMDRSRVLNFYKQRNVKQNRLGSRNVLKGDESNGFWPIYMICSLRNGLSPYPEEEEELGFFVLCSQAVSKRPHLFWHQGLVIQSSKPWISHGKCHLHK